MTATAILGTVYSLAEARC